MQVAVIGAGLGGLAAAARLAGAGMEVTVFEQNEAVGGKAGELICDGFRFDTGPSLLTMPFVVDALFADLKERRADCVDFHPLAVLCRYQFTDGTVLRSCPDVETFGAAVAAATTDSSRSVLRFMAHSEVLYRLAADFYLFRPLSGWLSYGRGVSREKGFWALRHLPHLGFAKSMHRLHARYFRDPRVVQLFDRYATYTGSDPFRCPATLALIPHVEHRLGACTVSGGTYRLVEAIRELALRQGVQILTGARVEGIAHDGRQVRGVMVDGQTRRFDAVVSAIDVNTTYQQLLDGWPLPSGRRHSRRDPSTSAIVFYWGVRGEFADLETHNIFFSHDYRREFGELRRGRCPADPTVYLYRSCSYAPADAPSGHENWFVMVNAPPDLGQVWEHETQVVRSAILLRLKSALNVDVAPRVVSERILTPPAIAACTGSHRGSLYGPASHGLVATFQRHPNRSRELKGLYFCGGSAHPGGGMALVLISASLACSELLRDSQGLQP
ncbi:MAG: phytoene desaturase [Armatimonadetes bacterium]|nr:phytoene desaturase [Armatimonadota bacterium]